MIARSLTLIGAAAVFATVAGTDIQAGSGHHKRVAGYKTHSCMKRVRTPDVYETRKRKVMVSRGHCTRKRTPAVYGWKQVSVVQKRARTVRHRSPAVYKTVTEQKMVRGAHTRWVHKRKGRDRYKCKVTVPAKYRTVKRRVMVSPRKTWTEKVPAVMGYKKVRTMVSRGKSERMCTPPVYKWVERKVRVKRGHHTWVKSAAPKC